MSLLTIAISASFLVSPGKAFSTTCISSTGDNAHGEQQENSTVTCTASDQGAFHGTIGNGPGNMDSPFKNNNVNVVINSGSELDPGNTSAISLGNNGNIIIKSGAKVTNSDRSPTEADQTSGNGFWPGTGPNTIEFGNLTTLVIEAGAEVSSYSPTGSAEAINVMGFGNRIVNHGTIYSNTSAAIWFEDKQKLEAGVSNEERVNILDNYGLIKTIDGESVIGSNGTDYFSDIYFINRKGAVVDGNIHFAGGQNQLELYAGSTINGDIDGGVSGDNTMVLTGNAGESQTFYGELKNFQKLIKNGQATWDMEGPLGLNESSSELSVLVQDGTLILGGENVYTGDTTIEGGVLATAHAYSLSEESTINIHKGGTLDLGGFSQIVPTINNEGIIKINAHEDSGTPGAILTVKGDYTGNKGLLQFSTYLHDDTSLTDMLRVQGNTAGLTYVRVINAGGSGAKTLNGIKLIQVDGESEGEFRTTYEPGNEFKLFNATDTVYRITAGAYDYYLERGTGGESDEKNWYLSNIASGADGGILERPEASSYSANLAAASNMFVTRLHDRLGETQYIDALTGETKVTSMWLRNQGGHNRSRDSHDQLSTQANSYVLQLGGDIAQWSSNDLDRFHLGVMAGYGNSKSRTQSNVSGYSSRGSVDGYSTGVYGTWYANDVDKTGLYIDVWAQYSWFNNTVSGQGLATEKYKSKGMTASVENGYTFKLGESASKNTKYFIQPKAQVTWMGVKADEHQEANGTHISGDGTNNIQTRLGVRTFMNGYSEQDKGKDRVFQPFVEANWVHNTKDFGSTMDGVTVKQEGAANIAELKLGVEGQLNKRLNVWGNVAQQVGNKGYSDTTAMLGVKYNF
ncbi:autotransporter outer membrane beta-barrel domain-containing protein [Yersinia sp. 2545 StPb PI]|uniref:autotransporter outer membrane beta-barrel domain-containing protein n=1 Tax=Yersinia sp. 2545 StPb PI TaxID=3117410 RepID=UPI003FA4211B